MKKITNVKTQTLIINVDICSQRSVNFVVNICLQFVQIRSSLVQHSAKFIPIQLLQNKQMPLASYHMLCFTSVIRQSFSTVHLRFIKIINVDKLTNAFVNVFVNVANV